MWLNRDAGWNSSHVDACLIHLRNCPRQPINVRNRAKSEHDMALCRRRERDRRRRENNSLPTADFGTINIGMAAFTTCFLVFQTLKTGTGISAALPAGSVPATSRRISEGISGSSIAPDIESQVRISLRCSFPTLIHSPYRGKVSELKMVALRTIPLPLVASPSRVLPFRCFLQKPPCKRLHWRFST